MCQLLDSRVQDTPKALQKVPWVQFSSHLHTLHKEGRVPQAGRSQ